MKYTDYYKHLNESLVDKKIITVPDEAKAVDAIKTNYGN